jgi:hypothetical protein
MARVRTLVKVYAVPDLYFRIRNPLNYRHLVPISPGTVGDILCQIIHPMTGIVITTVQFGDLYADIGNTAWEAYDEEPQQAVQSLPVEEDDDTK